MNFFKEILEEEYELKDLNFHCREVSEYIDGICVLACKSKSLYYISVCGNDK